MAFAQTMRVTVIPAVFGPLGTVPKGLEKGLKHFEIKGKIEIIKTTAFFISARILRIVMET